MEQYTILGRIGEGAHGIVFKAKYIEVSRMRISLEEVVEKLLIEDKIYIEYMCALKFKSLL